MHKTQFDLLGTGCCVDRGIAKVIINSEYFCDTAILIMKESFPEWISWMKVC